MRLTKKTPNKRIFAVLVAVFICVALCFLFTACNTSKYLETVDGTYVIGYGNYTGLDKGKAYISSLIYDGEHREFIIPDEYKGRKIASLGGYHGTGFPCPFIIDLSVVFDGYESSVYVIDDDLTDECIPIEFTVRLGRNISEIANVDGKSYYEATDSDGKIKQMYAVYHFEVSEDNSVFYSDNGRLYYRKDGSLVDEFYYE